MALAVMLDMAQDLFTASGVQTRGGLVEDQDFTLGIWSLGSREKQGSDGLLVSLLFFSQESPIRGTGQTQRAKGLQACGHYPEWMGVTGTQERVEQKCIYQSYAISQTPRKF